MPWAACEETPGWAQLRQVAGWAAALSAASKQGGGAQCTGGQISSDLRRQQRSAALQGRAC